MKFLRSNPFVFILLVLWSGAFAYFLENPMGTLGDDFNYFITYSLDRYLFTQLNPFQIQWWTPRFGGRIPSFPHPIDNQISVSQFFLQFLEPLRMLQATFVFISGLGSYFFFLFLRNIFKLNFNSSLL